MNAGFSWKTLSIAACWLLLNWPACFAQASTTGTLHIVAVLHDTTALARAHDIEVRDGLAFVAGKGGSLAIVEVKEPAKPRLCWSTHDKEKYEEAETVLPLGNNRLLVGTRDVLLFDVAQPLRPKLLATIQDRERINLINGFARLGEIVFGSNKLGHIFAVDLSAPDKIMAVGSRETRESGEMAYPHDVAFVGDLLVVVSAERFGAGGQPGKLVIYRVIEPQSHKVLPVEQWTVVGKIEHPRLAGANRVRTRGNYAYVGSALTHNLNRTDELRGNVAVIDLSDPSNPRLCGSVDFPDARGPNGLEILGAIVFAAGGQTVQAIDVASPEMPHELACLTAPEAFPGAADDAHDLVYADGHLFVTAQNSHALVVIRPHGLTMPDPKPLP